MTRLQRELRNYCYRLGYSIDSMRKYPHRRGTNYNPFPIGTMNLLNIQAGKPVSDNIESKLLTFLQEQKQKQCSTQNS
jgi:hypothetical protein